MKSSLFWNLLFPSIFFMLLLGGWGFSSSNIVVICITAGLLLLIGGNIFLKSNIINLTIGFFTLLGSCYMLLAIWDDFIDGEATKGYWIGVTLFVFSLAMSILYMIGYRKKKNIE